MNLAHALTKLALTAAGLLLTATFSTQAAAVVIGFEGVVGDGSSSVPITPYTESGYTFTNSTRSTGNSDGIFGKNFGNNSGSATLVFCSTDSGCTSGTAITVVGAAPFTVLSIDAGTYLKSGANGSLEVIGNILGGGTVTQSLAITNTFTKNTLIGFSNLTSFNLIGHITYAVGVDNLVINKTVAVPEPASIALLGLGLLGFAASRRKPTKSKNA